MNLHKYMHLIDNNYLKNVTICSQHIYLAVGLPPSGHVISCFFSVLACT